MTSKFKTQLYNILESLKSIESKDVVLTKCVEDKLTNSLEQYRNDIRNMYNYVLSRSNVKVIKAISKLNAKGEINHGS